MPKRRPPLHWTPARERGMRAFTDRGTRLDVTSATVPGKTLNLAVARWLFEVGLVVWHQGAQGHRRLPKGPPSVSLTESGREQWEWLVEHPF